MSVLPSLAEFLQPFASQMTTPTFASFCTVLCGWLFARRRTVTGALRACGEAPPKHHSAYHRVFAAARWSLDAAGLAMLALVLDTPGLLGATASMPFLVIDDTVCRRAGWRMFGVDSHYDSAGTGRKLSNANRSLKTRGHCWVVLGVVVPVPFRPGHYICLPLLFRLYMNRKAAARNGKAYRSKPDLARDLVKLVAGTHPGRGSGRGSGRAFHLLVDSAYAGQDTLRGLPEGWEMTARWQMKIRLRTHRGEELPTPAEMIGGRCGRLSLDVFGNRQAYRVASCEACLNTVRDRLVRVVVTELLSRGGKAGGKAKAKGRKDRRACLYSTCVGASAEQVLTWYALRWGVEVAFRDAKQQLGCEEPQAWCERGVLRSTPTLMLAYSAVVLWFFREGRKSWRGGPRVAAGWYPHKARPKGRPGGNAEGGVVSFADMLATLRKATLRHTLKADLRAAAASPRRTIRTLFNVVSLAA